MVGPGTGVAPFRAFVQERAARRRHCSGGGAGGGAGGEGEDGGGGGVGDAVLYFGCRGAACDYLYAAEWEAHLASGALRALHTAFSREGTAKVYVQHRMQEPANAAALWALLRQDDAHVYIAGAANQMPKAVRQALRVIALHYGGLDEPAATDFVKQLEACKRLQCETW